MKFTRIKLYSLAVFAALLTTTACGSDDPEPVNEEELITTLKVTFTGTGPNEGETVEAIFKDLDGTGGDDPEITNPVELAANGSYDVSVAFLNEAESPAENITLEVEEEGDEHQVFFVANNINFTYQYGDEDVNTKPIGLSGSVLLGAAGTGTLQVLLIHEPDKDASGVSTGSPTNAGGETDISVTFNVTIK
ncbi:hypothetical protein [Roseivirga echinicomitans]|uniref:Type 1 periplasmic binding fold superfamily protein n=1 Tax=Roseivirga echinicomitans TaxID=296218 RepID=A0A150XK07_9BACT|nr:hypothetical protein [Roseivirga echinicomitans]KYG79002.1 hypothetical protein AWN68_05055 [Roseivirga echinicomitans]